nr:unnamed protein product [Leishmania braziliensis]
MELLTYVFYRAHALSRTNALLVPFRYPAAAFFYLPHRLLCIVLWYGQHIDNDPPLIHRSNLSLLFACKPLRTMAVVLHTTVGDLPVLLHYQTCPLASFNFLALCASGYYDGCTFYRHYPGILLQTGDPTNTGKGGESIFVKLPPLVNAADGSEGGDAVSVEAASVAAAGIRAGRYFHDEGFGLTTHAQRGTLSMAHKGVKTDTNASQFFITTSPQPSFDGVYTAFGVVDMNGAYSASEAAVVAVVANSTEGEAVGNSSAMAGAEAVGDVALKCGDAVLRALEAASAKVDPKNFVHLESRAHITSATILYNPFAEGKMKL